MCPPARPQDLRDAGPRAGSGFLTCMEFSHRCSLEEASAMPETHVAVLLQ